jgi:raffinose/stachyose/melibiose transport system permease protein
MSSNLIASGKRKVTSSLVHFILLIYSAISLFPIVLVLINSVKTRRSIFNDPLALPDFETFTLVGYTSILEQGNFIIYFKNSITITVVSLFLILVLGAMAAHALAEYRFKGDRWLALFFAIGIMIPIRLGTVSILKLMVTLDLTNTLTGLILVYTAQGLPLAIFIMSEFMRQVPKDLKDAARIDGLNEYSIFLRIVFPLIRPVASTVAVFTMVPVWNDLWFPLILTSMDSTKTITLGAQQFIGQFVTDWNAVLATLSLAMLPVLVLYLIFSRQLIKGITSGAVK